MFIETKNQEGTENPMGVLFHIEKVLYHKFLLIVSLLTMVGFFTATVFNVNDFGILPKFISGLFFLDFLYRFMKAENKKAFMVTGWIDLVLSIPFLPTQWSVVILMLRCVKNVVYYILLVINNAFTSMLSIGLCLVVFSTVSILQFEGGDTSNIKTAWDATWWSLCTITTVGYGDKFPVTDSGKVVAIILMISGIGLFGTLIGYISTFFTDKEKQNNSDIDTIEELSHQISKLREELTNNKK